MESENGTQHFKTSPSLGGYGLGQPSALAPCRASGGSTRFIGGRRLHVIEIWPIQLTEPHGASKG